MSVSKNLKVFEYRNKSYQFDAKKFDAISKQYKSKKRKTLAGIEYEIASKINVSDDAVRNWRYGKNGPSSLEIIEQISKVLGLKDLTSLLVEFEGEKKMYAMSDRERTALKKVYDSIIDFLYEFAETDGFELVIDDMKSGTKCEITENMYDEISKKLSNIHRTYRKEVESKIYGLSDYSGNYDGFTSPYEFPIVMRLPTGKGTVSGTIQWESEKQPLYSTPTGLTGTLVTSTNYSIQARVKLTNLSTGSAYYSSYFSTNSSGKYQYSVSNLPDGEYSFEIDSPYGYIDVSSLPETITIDGRTLIVSGAVNKSEASSGSVSGTVTYDVNGNYDAIYGATVSFKRLGDSSNSASVSTSATGTFASGNIKRGFYQITIKLPSTLGGATFYYRMFVGDTHDITLRLAVPTKSITGTVYAYLNSSTAIQNKEGDFRLWIIMKLSKE